MDNLKLIYGGEIDKTNSMWIHADASRVCGVNEDIRKKTWKNVLIFGGWYANIGEDNMSELVYNSKDQLETFCYLPHNTKGGDLVRPGYHKISCDRDAVEEFPKLHTLCITRYVDRSPLRYGWKTPNLKTLVVLIERPAENDRELSWIDPTRNPKYVFQECPLLEKIIICQRADTFDKTLDNVVKTIHR